MYLKWLCQNLLTILEKKSCFSDILYLCGSKKHEWPEVLLPAPIRNDIYGRKIRLFIPKKYPNIMDFPALYHL